MFNIPAPEFLIPYWSGDRGVRPLDPSRLYWNCEAILIDGDYVPGEDLTVRVRIKNAGKVLSDAQVHVWWADPTTGFTLGNGMTVIGSATVDVDPDDTVTTPQMVKRIPHGAPDHICLIARVQRIPDDTAPTGPGNTPLPGSDEHWAQRNLNAKKVQPGVPFVHEFHVGNPFAEKMEFVVTATPTPKRDYEPLMAELKATVVGIDSAALISESPKELSGKPSLFFTLGPRERRKLYLHGKLQSKLSPDEFGVIEIEQRGQGELQTVTGSIGVILQPE